ncbi:MAG: membrane protein insertion efficiency factor YidD [Eubacteriales bacterium]|nr:membrane protein insertion efficiency factor YidD [Eubacteriales bacterium]
MRKLLLKLLSFYKKSISPYLPDSCRFTPTCSEYMREAVERFGAGRGFWMGLKRLLRCNPFSKGGYDPVPESPEQPIRRE